MRLFLRVDKYDFNESLNKDVGQNFYIIITNVVLELFLCVFAKEFRSLTFDVVMFERLYAQPPVYLDLET